MTGLVERGTPLEISFGGEAVAGTAVFNEFDIANGAQFCVKEGVTLHVSVMPPCVTPWCRNVTRQSNSLKRTASHYATQVPSTAVSCPTACNVSK